jgi:hypothetical protein
VISISRTLIPWIFPLIFLNFALLHIVAGRVGIRTTRKFFLRCNLGTSHKWRSLEFCLRWCPRPTVTASEVGSDFSLFSASQLEAMTQRRQTREFRRPSQ